MAGIQRWNGGGYGQSLKDDYRKFYGSTIAFQGLGEMIPNKDSYCEIDPQRRGQVGHPGAALPLQVVGLRAEARSATCSETCRDLVDKMGGTPLDPMPGEAEGYGITVGGEMIHEVGTTRMGESAKTSVLNANCQAHDVPNLFVADGGPFVSNADKNPTWTILALAVADERVHRRGAEEGKSMSEIGRRGWLKVIGAVPLAGARARAQRRRRRRLSGQGGQGERRARPSCRSSSRAHEYETVRVLVDLVIPRDERSGSATDAGVPEFMDFMMRDPLESPQEREKRQTAMRGGLAWLDHQCADRFGKSFVACTEVERKARARRHRLAREGAAEMKQGAHFFSDFRDLTASGFWSSKIGIEDLQYQGNTFVAEWKGCPPEVLARLGLKDE